MDPVKITSLLIMSGMIGWQWREHCQRRAFEREATRDRARIRKVAEGAASDAASCAAVIDRIEKPRRDRRHMHAVRDDRSGVSTWNWGETNRG